MRSGCTSRSMAHAVIIRSKGRVTLPKSLRERHHLVEGDVALTLDSSEGILIRHGRPTLRGMLRGRLEVATLEKDLAKLRRYWTS
jgi:bifunctional DNA-binding transcriptional regulator/antitoxin component of YhaV-PrlF toxin-antitoxin module